MSAVTDSDDIHQTFSSSWEASAVQALVTLKHGMRSPTAVETDTLSICDADTSEILFHRKIQRDCAGHLELCALLGREMADGNFGVKGPKLPNLGNC